MRIGALGRRLHRGRAELRFTCYGISRLARVRFTRGSNRWNPGAPFRHLHLLWREGVRASWHRRRVHRRVAGGGEAISAHSRAVIEPLKNGPIGRTATVLSKK